MIITRTRDEQEFYRISAMRIAEVIKANPMAKIGFSTGRTTGGVHKALAALYNKEKFDCSNITVFGIDEITNMSRDCKASCYYILLHEVVVPLGIPMKNYIMPDPFAADMKKECADFEQRVTENGSPDMIFLGLGENGHLGFNQPGTNFGQSTWTSFMDDSLDSRLRLENNIPSDVKMGGLTLGIKNLMQCPKLVMAANGKNKTAIAERMVHGEVTQELPASILQIHPCVELILDNLAGEGWA